ncbi:MAG: hypothetical protein HGB04_03930 [Chlorobiaceae bacterium]|nr:hypothetical protein [Chlorobiaceae bacterium]
MTERVSEVLGMKCKIVEGTRYVELHLLDRHHVVREKSIERATIVLGHWLSRRGHLKSDVVDREVVIREMLRSIRLPAKPIKVTGSRWRRFTDGRIQVRIKIWNDGISKAYIAFGPASSVPDARKKSRRLCVIVNQEIARRNATIYPPKVMQTAR